MQFIVMHWNVISIVLHVCILGLILYGSYRAFNYLITQRVLRRNLEDLYSNLRGMAIARGKSEAELQAMYGNRAKVSFIDKFDEALKYSGIAFEYEWLTTELCVVMMGLFNAAVFVISLISSSFLMAVVLCLGCDGLFAIYVAHNRKKNYESVEHGLITFINTIDAYSATTSDLVTLLEQSVNSVDGAFRGYIVQTIDDAKSRGDLSRALSICEDRVEHPFLKMLMRNLNIASRNTANYSEIIRGCRSRLQEDLANTQKTKAIYSSLRGQMLTLLILGLVSVYIATRFVANVSLFELLNAMQQSFIGMTVIVYMIAILAAIVYFAFIRQNRRK